MKYLAHRIAIALIALLIISCTPDKPAPVDARDLDPYSTEAFCAFHLGDSEAGEALFNQPLLGDEGGCITCHSLQPDTILVGPSLYGIADIATTRILDVLPANYLYLSIIEPNHYVVDGYSTDVMPQNYQEALTQTDINNLVSDLMSQIVDE